MGWSNNSTWPAELEPMLVKRDPLYIVVPMSVLYGTIFVTGLLGNLVTCLIIARNRHMHTATNYYLFSLAVSDLLLLLTGLPQEIYSIWSRYPYIWGEVWCVGRGLAAETSANATVLTITAFTVERYVAICHPFLAHTTSNLTRAAKSILLIWLLAILLAAPQALQFGVAIRDISGQEIAECGQVRILIAHSFEISTFLFFVTPMILITVLYAMIGLRLRKTQLRDSKPPALCKQHTNSQRVLKMLVAVVVAFFICWAPFHVQRLMAIYLTERLRSKFAVKVFEAVTYLSGILYYLSTTINPILYHIMSNKFRMAFKETVRGWLCRGGSGAGKREYEVLSRARSATDSSTKDEVHNAAAVPANGGRQPQPDNTSWRWTCMSRSSPEPCVKCSHNISNSSLKDVDRTAIRDELIDFLTNT